MFKFIPRNKYFKDKNKLLLYEGNKIYSRINKDDKDVREIVKIFHWCVEWSPLILAWLESLDKLL